jgi:hypothetical protein
MEQDIIRQTRGGQIYNFLKGWIVTVLIKLTSIYLAIQTEKHYLQLVRCLTYST